VPPAQTTLPSLRRFLNFFASKILKISFCNNALKLDV